MEKIIIYGGAFNPPHLGHLHCVNFMKKHFPEFHIVLVPTGVPPHKSVEALLSKEDRLHMLELAFGADKGVSICQFELESKVDNYTINTIEYFQQKFHCSKMMLLIGSDQFLNFTKWHRYEEIVACCQLLVMARKQDDIHKINELKNQFNGKAKVFVEDILSVSSTEIREKIKKGENTQRWLAEQVSDYIDDHHFYR